MAIVRVYALAHRIDTIKGYYESAQININIDCVEKTLQEAITAGDLSEIELCAAGEILQTVEDNWDCVTESDPTVLASVKDGIDWSEITGIPADGDDDTNTYMPGGLYGYCQFYVGDRTVYRTESPMFNSGTFCACPAGFTIIPIGAPFSHSFSYWSCYKN